MKWFKHETNAHTDAKLKRLRIRYGLEGLGFYWYCLELIGSTVEPHNLTFELEHDSEVIADDLNLNIDHVQEMMKYIIDLGLFEQNGVVITCLKMAVRADEYTQKSLRKLHELGHYPDNLLTMSGHTPDKIPSNRKKERKKETIGRFNPPSVEEVQNRISEMGYQYSEAEEFCNFYGSKNWMVGKNKMSDWHKALGGWESRKKKDKPRLQFVEDWI